MTAVALRLLVLWCAAAMPLFVWLNAFEMFEQPKQLAIKLAGAAAAALLALVPRPEAPPALLGPVAAILTLGALAAAVSPLPLTAWFGEYTSYQGWLHWAALAALLWATATVLRRPENPRRVLAAATCALALVALYALLQLAGLDPVPWSVNGPIVRTFSTAGNPLYLGCLLAAGFPASLGLAATAPTAAARWGKLALSALILAGIVSSGSRSALAAAGLGAFAFFRLSGAALPPRLIRHAVIAGGTALLVGGLLLPADRNPFPLLARRSAEVLRGEDGRPLIWMGALRLVRERPLLGHGQDTFATLAPRVQSPALWTYLWHGSPEKAHNDLLQFLATVGIPGTGAILWLAAVLVRCAAAFRGPLNAAAAGGLIAYAVSSLFAFATSGPQVLALLFAGMLAARSADRPVPRMVPAGLAGVLALSLLVHLQFATAEVAMKSSLRAGGSRMESALALRTPWAQRLLRAGDLLEHAALGQTMGGAPAAGSPRTMALIDRMYAEAGVLNPLHPFAHSDRGRMLARAGRYQEAIEAYAVARRLAPLDAYLAMEAAQIMVQAGRDAEARALLLEVTGQYPGFAEPFGLMGYTWIAHRDWARAVPWFEQALTRDWHGNAGSRYAAANNLAAAYHHLGREAEAARAAASAQPFAPGAP